MLRPPKAGQGLRSLMLRCLWSHRGSLEPPACSPGRRPDTSNKSKEPIAFDSMTTAEIHTAQQTPHPLSLPTPAANHLKPQPPYALVKREHTVSLKDIQMRKVSFTRGEKTPDY